MIVDEAFTKLDYVTEALTEIDDEFKAKGVKTKVGDCHTHTRARGA